MAEFMQTAVTPKFHMPLHEDGMDGGTGADSGVLMKPRRVPWSFISCWSDSAF